MNGKKIVDRRADLGLLFSTVDTEDYTQTTRDAASSAVQNVEGSEEVGES